MKPVRSLMVKPASSACNLNCTYCFYKDEAAKRKTSCTPVMSQKTARKMLETFISSSSALTIGFQGGEPTLAGLKWFEDFFKTAKKLNQTNIPINWSFQTNGTLLDDSWGKFFKENNVLVGVSLDGFPRLHNLYRKTTSGDRSSGLTESGIAALKRCHADFNILVVVTNEVCDNFDRLWSRFEQDSYNYLQFIPCMDPLEGQTNRFLDPEKYGHFLVDLFDRYSNAIRAGEMVSVRLFDNWLDGMFGYMPEACDMRGVCSIQYVAESDGTIYPCDFCCTDDFALGNIVSDSLEQIDAARQKMDFVKRGLPLPKKCESCPYVVFCRNGCPRNRDENNCFRFCSSYRYFFQSRLESMKSLAGYIWKMDQK